jgi:hypothetical protein
VLTIGICPESKSETEDPEEDGRKTQAHNAIEQHAGHVLHRRRSSRHEAVEKLQKPCTTSQDRQWSVTSRRASSSTLESDAISATAHLWISCFRNSPLVDNLGLRIASLQDNKAREDEE